MLSTHSSGRGYADCLGRKDINGVLFSIRPCMRQYPLAKQDMPTGIIVARLLMEIRQDSLDGI